MAKKGVEKMTLTERLKKAVEKIIDDADPDGITMELADCWDRERRECGEVSPAGAFTSGVAYVDHRLQPILTALIECVEALDELNDILDDPEAREEIDSFTGQTARAAIGLLEKELGGATSDWNTDGEMSEWGSGEQS